MDPEELAAAFVLSEPTSRTEELIELLVAGEISPVASRARVARRILLGGGEALERTMVLLTAWRQDSDGATRLARTLTVLLKVRQEVESRGVRAELVWTGRKPAGSPLRNTAQVVNEMLDQATRHIVIVAYSLWFGQGDVGGVLARLARARRRQAHVTFVVDRNYGPASAPSGHNLNQIRSKWPPDVARPDVYTWGNEADEIAKLHAKVVVVDRRDLLVTSANLTGHGMEGNLELGVRLEGRQAAQAHDHVMALISAGVFRREELW